MNERLASQPELINTKAATEGYIAIVQGRKEEEDTLCSSSPLLISAAKYREVKGAQVAA